jgi:asparagine synthase (glutamine-hydrolysing)
MCGIAGFAGTQNPGVLSRMVATLEHRGPDSAGFWESPQASLGMRRLAIVDPATGQQPVFNEDRSLVCVFNGEIYNHVELRQQLLLQGHRFRTHHSDTETLVHLYEQYGLDFPNHLNGMFAVAIWDARAERLILVRDRAGIKPLYFAEEPGRGLVFGSEPKALLAHPNVSSDPDFEALSHYFTLKNIPAPRSAFAGIGQLRPGELIVWENGRLERKRWWNLRYREDPRIGIEDAAAEIRRLLFDSVRLQMAMDVPFGAYLSGGVDSSAVVGIMAQLHDHPVRTYTLVYDDDSVGKSADQKLAREVAAMYGTDHSERLVTATELPEAIDGVVRSFDEPFSGVISTYFVTELIGRDVKVALSGDGADELFASYRSHRLARPLSAWRQYRSGDRPLSNEEQALIAELRLTPEELDRLIAQGSEAATRMEQYLIDDRTKADLFSPKMHAAAAASTETLIEEHYASAGTDDPLNRALFVDFNTLLPDQVLAFVDRLSMAHSVEVRPPFLDHRLMEFAATIPGHLKINRNGIKQVLKRAVRGIVPDAIIHRPKEGFLMPTSQWILDKLQPYARQRLAPERLALHGLIEPTQVAALLNGGGSASRRQGDRLWSLLMFQLWWEAYQT